MFTSKFTRPEILDCVTYVLTMIESPTNYHKNRNLNTDLLFTKKTQMFVLSHIEDQCAHVETFFSKHNDYILIILQQIIQSQRFENISTVLKGALKNTIKWMNSNIHIDLIRYVTDPQDPATTNTRRAKNELIYQGVKTEGVQYYNTHQESILLNIVTESDIYNNYSYTSCVDLEIEKTPETHPKKLESNIDKPETGLKKIDFNIDVNNDEIDYMNNESNSSSK